MSKDGSRPRPAGSRMDGRIETSGSEKVLAVVLAVFIAIGAIWGYAKLDEVTKDGSASTYAPDRKLIDAGELAAIEKHRQAVRSVGTARSDRSAAVRQLELRREAYRTALDADQPSAELQVEYELAQARLASASKEVAAAVAVERRTRPPALRAERHLTELRREAAEREDADRADHERTVFLLRLVLLALMLGGSYWLLSRLRSRSSRYLPAALAWIGATAILACVMAVDYTNTYLGFDDVGPLAISILGIVLTLAAFVALQRFLAKRIPTRRVRRGECPFCGFPVSEKPHCEGCGRAVIASCSSCQKDRRVGTLRCGHCGNA